MSVAIGNIIKITDFQSFLGQLMENVYFYRLTAVPAADDGFTVDETICNKFNADVRLLVLPLQESSCQHTITRMDNLSDGVSFAEVSAPAVGTISGDPEPSFMAYNFVLRRSSKITRNGSKRIGGLDEGGVSGNGITTVGPALTALGTAMAAPLSYAVGGVATPFAEPVIVGRVKVALPDGGFDYVLDLAKINPIASAAFTAVSTQRSRKAGKGL